MSLTNHLIAGSGLATLLLGPNGETVVRVVYSDESGTGSKHNELITVVTAIMLNMDSQWHPILGSIEKALFDYKGEKNPHNYEIKGKKLYRDIKSGDEKAANFMTALMKIPLQHLCPVFYKAIDRKGYAFYAEHYLRPMFGEFERYSSAEGPRGTFVYTLRKCMLQVDTYVHTSFPDEQVLWIHDKVTYEEPAKEHLKFLRNQIDNGSPMSKESLFRGEPYPAKSHIVDTVYFGKSEESRAIQLVDACCSTITLHLLNDPVAEPYYQFLHSQIINKDNQIDFRDYEQKVALEKKSKS